MQIIGGLIGAILSILLIIYRVPVKHFIGNIAWAEAHLGPGGTFTLLLLVGIFGFFLSLMVMTGTLDFLLGGLTETLFGGGRSAEG
jgi:hypothetical protein